MSDLTATNCGCGSSCGCGNNNIFGGNSCFLIILLLLFCGGNCNGSGILGGSSCDHGCDHGRGNNNCCEWLIWILILSFFCGNNNSCC